MTDIKVTLPEVLPTPTSNRLLVLPDPAEEKTRGGLIIPQTDQKRTRAGQIVAIGPDVKHAKIGQRVSYGEYSGQETKFEDIDFLVMREDDALLILPN
ncbi:GroS Co-chaperonin GroES (HSP10) [uncultured Caudovirales phage]|uniref:GroS Co-chaperonin GroES (HSP10) n=1 Tax=uncultured Caudovirales phage TaxID=2100421 RepID=A0A6J5SS33_9CAUD|nr:GroS Co-chaperonin GroES (HSP10) [uncultured Caudovirales phage]CAB4193544.1 GroS Co-chaperonin GroES (HSP10) [uncultured Caudovirales phage]CAB4217361.1 GroS Co-chaperonin GroES (HSP10) [uncultured Caudovirales phage]CAB5231295.1 GroS Co-chaperonin GroES (HSP10) [uncultured Caudovirales phage]